MGGQEVRIYDPLEVFATPQLNSGETAHLGQAFSGTDVLVEWGLLSFGMDAEKPVPQTDDSSSFGENIMSISQSSSRGNLSIQSPDEPSKAYMFDFEVHKSSAQKPECSNPVSQIDSVAEYREHSESRTMDGVEFGIVPDQSNYFEDIFNWGEMIQFNTYDESLSFEGSVDDNKLVGENLAASSYQFSDSSLLVPFQANSMELSGFDTIPITTILSPSSRVSEVAEVENVDSDQLFPLFTDLSF